MNRYVFLIGLGLLLVSCDHDTFTSTEVHEDGSVDKTVSFNTGDSAVANINYFGISSKDGWELTEVEQQRFSGGELKAASVTSKSKTWLLMRKYFDSFEKANQELNSDSDTLFRIKSNFKKSFKWFYSYIYYEDIYRSINRFKYVSISDYLTQEDMAFIERMPAEGDAIGSADNVYLEGLNNKIYEQFLPRAFFEEQYKLIEILLKENTANGKWLDSLSHHKESIYELFNDEEFPEIDLTDLADSFKIPSTVLNEEQYEELFEKLLRPRFDFMSWANEGKYEHSISIPWELMETNADSVQNNVLIWNPPVTKFLFNDYTMYVEMRKINTWAVVVSAFVLLTTLIVLFMKRQQGS